MFRKLLKFLGLTEKTMPQQFIVVMKAKHIQQTALNEFGNNKNCALAKAIKDSRYGVFFRTVGFQSASFQIGKKFRYNFYNFTSNLGYDYRNWHFQKDKAIAENFDPEHVIREFTFTKQSDFI